MREVGSPVDLAAVTNSRLRIESVCARNTLAPHDQPVMMRTKPMINGPL